MPSKKFDVNKRARDKWYKNNKKKQIDQQLERRRQLKIKLREYKKSLACEDCGMSFMEYPECLDFHHLDPSAKNDNIGTLVLSSEKKMFAEIKKCVPLCSNCHRKRHRFES